MLHYSKFLRDNAMTNHSSPTCVVTFADKQVTRMTVWSANGKPDLRRGIHLAWAAYESRKRVVRLRKQKGITESSVPEKHELPAITALHFEIANGENVTTTEKFTAEEIAKAIDGFTEATDDSR
jgi:hypothetical protein